MGIQENPADTRARQLVADIDDLIRRARALGLETVVYVLETARIEALRASRPAAPVAADDLDTAGAVSPSLPHRHRVTKP